MLTFPWRKRLAQDGELLGHLSRIFVSTVAAFYRRKACAITLVQRTSSDLRLKATNERGVPLQIVHRDVSPHNPHLHVVFLDGSNVSRERSWARVQPAR